ncbi:MAG TPA: BtpA/SgcQ family protein [Geobacteraceae bacterium]|nr:BtpA/SgcQ family protein [Geobacteraceae bacterium]
MRKTEKFIQTFGTEKPIIGMVHLLPLPGAPAYHADTGMKRIIAAAVEDAMRLVEGGVDGIQIENQGDWPFLKPDEIGFETVAAVTAVVSLLRMQLDLPMGINIHLNGVCQALAIAAATDCQWVRAFELANAYVSPSGIIEAAGPQALRYREFLNAGNKVMILGDFHVKHGSHNLTADKSLVEQARDVAASMTDGIIVTGRATGTAPCREELSTIREAVRLPLLIGSGLALENLEELLPLADGAIVGSSFKADDQLKNPVDVSRVKRFMQAVRAVRQDN